MAKRKQGYFSHDSNARLDPKIIKLRMSHGAAGYGVYFMLLERMRESPDYMSVKDYNLLAFDLRVDSGVVKSVVEDFNLFECTEDGKKFFSPSFMRRMKIKDQEQKVRSDRARKGAEARWGKESKENEKP